ncbi:MAG: hypothetical protein JSR75_14050 [Proteobacteria bacterium]|nr:hypothetical protein [Pseudomonadota bacterium]
MTIPAWKIVTWPTVPTPLDDWQQAVHRLRHLGMSVHVDEGEKPLRYGQLLWGFESHDVMLGIAWDWREVMPDVVAIADPMSIVSNACFVDEEGAAVDDAVRMMYLNSAVYQLPWQTAVCAARHRMRAAAVLA